MTDCELHTAHCPYCGEALELLLDPSAGTSHYVEDCHVCCRPIEVRYAVDHLGRIHDLITCTDEE